MTTKICIGLLSNRGFQQQMVDAYGKLVAYSAKLYDLHFEMATEGYTIAENRNSLAAKACQNDCSHLLMIDDDMVFPEYTLESLMRHDKDIVAINYHPRQFGDGYMVWVKGEMAGARTPESRLPRTLFECDGVGFGSVLIKTELFRKIERPWFGWQMYDTGMVKEGEDFYFCRKAREAGYTIWCDPTIKPIFHIGKHLF